MAAVLKALEISFSKAKSKGLKVMVSTSYLSPYNAYDDVAYNKRAQELGGAYWPTKISTSSRRNSTMMVACQG